MTDKANSLLQGFNDLFKKYPYVALFMFVVLFGLDVSADDILKRVTRTDVVKKESFDTLSNDVHENKESLTELKKEQKETTKALQDLKETVESMKSNKDNIKRILEAVQGGK